MISIRYSKSPDGPVALSSFVKAVSTAILLLTVVSGSHAALYIDVNSPHLSRMPIAIPDFVPGTPGVAIHGRELAEILRNDLYMTGLFQIVEEGPNIPTGPADEPDYDAWAAAGAQAVVLGSFDVRGDELVIEARLYEVALKKLDFGKRFSGSPKEHRRMVHRFGDRIMENLTGTPGCFSTRIAFVGAERLKEVFVMDFDGHGIQQVTRNGSINLSPAWSPDLRKLLFTSYVKGNPDLWALDLVSGKITGVSNRRGLNASACYSPDGNAIAIALSANGNSDIFILSPQGQILKRLTHSGGSDISPSWSPDGSSLVYVSDRAGAPQIYRMPANGGESVRLTFESNYNTDPDWSPRGDRLAFTARIEGRFQICTMGVDGSDIRVLTSEGSNTSPVWSPDGRMIAFTSDRDGFRRIYVMDESGQIQVPVSPVPGKSPAWSGRLW
jgi:TolB protein